MTSKSLMLYRHLLQIALDTTLFEDFRGSTTPTTRKRPTSSQSTYCLVFPFCGCVKVRFSEVHRVKT